MIAFLSGEVAAVLPPNTAYIDVTGVGYAVSMPQGDLGKLEVGKPARVLTYLSVSDNGLGLYGFLSDEEKALFEKLIGVSKVGPKMALAAQRGRPFPPTPPASWPTPSPPTTSRGCPTFPVWARRRPSASFWS